MSSWTPPEQMSNEANTTLPPQPDPPLPEGGKWTGVYATEEEYAELVRLHTEACDTPIMLVAEVNLSEWAWNRFHERIQALAMEHGLPDADGYYGIGLNREFIAAEDWNISTGCIGGC